MTEKSADKQRSAFRFDRHFFQGLIIGVLAAVIIGLGITAIAKPEVFRGSDATESMLGESTPGGVLLRATQVVTPDDFEAEVLDSSRPELVVVVDSGAASASLDNLVEMISLVWDGNDVKYHYATDDASLQYIRGLSVRTGEEQPSLAMFYQGRLVAQQSLLMDADSAALWVTRNNPAKPAPTPTTASSAPTRRSPCPSIQTRRRSRWSATRSAGTP